MHFFVFVKHWSVTPEEALHTMARCQCRRTTLFARNGLNKNHKFTYGKV